MKSDQYFAVHEMRFGDARVLFERGRFNGAVYLAGYAIECLLKCIVREHSPWVESREIRTHDYATLIRLAGLGGDLRGNREVGSDYARINRVWDVEMRYETRSYNGSEAKDFIESLRGVRKWRISKR